MNEDKLIKRTAMHAGEVGDTGTLFAWVCAWWAGFAAARPNWSTAVLRTETLREAAVCLTAIAQVAPDGVVTLDSARAALRDTSRTRDALLRLIERLSDEERNRDAHRQQRLPHTDRSQADSTCCGAFREGNRCVLIAQHRGSHVFGQLAVVPDEL